MDVNRQIVLFTDLDGTLIDTQGYSFEKALPALALLREKNIPLVLCSSKTRAEIELYRRRLENEDPFVSENGGGIFIPVGYFGRDIVFESQKTGGYDMMLVGARYEALRAALGELRASGFDVTGFGDMSEAEVSAITGLNEEEARLCKERAFDEPFVFHGTKEEKAALIGAITELGFRHTEGRYQHIMGASDKGVAVRILMGLYQKRYGEIVTVALGDGMNDLEMLREVDYPIIVQKDDGTYEERIEIANLKHAEGRGPEGWRLAVERLIMGLSA